MRSMTKTMTKKEKSHLCEISGAAKYVIGGTYDTIPQPLECYKLVLTW